YKPDLSDVGPQGSPNRNANRQVGTTVTAPNGREGRILIRGTWNTDIVEALKPEPGDIALHKTRFSGFYQTDLDSILKGLGARSLIVTGCTTSICVESTIRDAMFRDYSPDSAVRLHCRGDRLWPPAQQSRSISLAHPTEVRL